MIDEGFTKILNSIVSDEYKMILLAIESQIAKTSASVPKIGNWKNCQFIRA